MELKQRSLPLEITCFKTSIWDETLYMVIKIIIIIIIIIIKSLNIKIITFYLNLVNNIKIILLLYK